MSIEKIENLNVSVSPDDGNGTNRIRIYNGQKNIDDLWISNTGELDSPDEALDMELRALYYAIEHINDLGKVIQMCFEDACSPSGRVSKKAAIELMKFADTRA